MAERKIHIVQNNGPTEQKYDSEPDFWTKLLVDPDFKNLNSYKVWKLLSLALAELLGTATFVSLGCSSLIGSIEGTEDHVTHLNIAITFGFAIALVVMVFGHISGCHVNPAVSLSAVIFGIISLPKFLLYTVSQCLGAILGILLVKMIAPESCTNGSFCVTQPNYEVGAFSAMLSEALHTAFLVWAVNAAWDRRCQDKHDSLPVKFGVVITALVIPGAKYSGGSMNPARSFGPALISGNFTNHWVYWVGPLGGSVVASAIYKTFLAETIPPQTVTTRTDEEAEEEHPL